VPLAARALEATDDRERAAAIAALGELGGTLAAGALAARLLVAAGEELEQVVAALAWLRDPRALEAARRLAPAALERYNPDRRNPVWALVRLGDDADRELLRERLAAMADNPSSREQALGRLANALAAEDTAAAPDVYARAGLTSAGAAQMQTREPLGARTVPRLALAELSTEPVGDDGPQAKFGGEPDWIDTPAWPHTSGGRPLIFYGQLPLLGQPRRTAYVFVGFDASWEPLGEGNAVVVQPGPAPSHIAHRPCATGPGLYEDAPRPLRFRNPQRRYRRYERFVRLADGADPERWEWPDMPTGTYARDAHGDWNKIGGTGLWLQGEPRLPGDGWRFAFQFTASWAGRELADGAECYGFVRDDGTAALAWDCH
jgi:hypothetical protein